MRVALQAGVVAVMLALLAGCATSDGWEPRGGSSWARAAYPDTTDYTSERYLSPGASAVVVLGIFDLGFLCLVVSAAARARRHDRRASAARTFGLGAELSDGLAEIAGTVELEPGAAGAPVAEEIRQAGTERVYKGSRSHEWREEGRFILFRPFWLRLEGEAGIRIRVEPDERVEVHAPLSRIERTDHDARSRFAEITEGARVRVTGNLRGWAKREAGGVYREGAAFPVLQPPVGAPMVIDAEAHVVIESARARLHQTWAILAGIAFALAWALLAPTYHLLLLTGTRTTAVTEATRADYHAVHQSGHNRTGATRTVSYELRGHVTLPDGRGATVDGACSYALAECVRAGGCAEVPFLVSSLDPWFAQVGSRAACRGDAGVVLVLLTVGMFFLYLGNTREERPWYRGRRVVDQMDGPLVGTGR